MDNVARYDLLQQSIAAIRRQNRGFVTNFFLSPGRVARLAAAGRLLCVEYACCVWLLHRESDFNHLYYLAAGVDGLREGLVHFLSNDGAELPFVVDLVGTSAEANAPIATVFRQSGFSAYRRLHRMSRTEGLDAPQRKDERICFATPAQAMQVHGLLMTYFDRFSDQIPSWEELSEMAEAQRVLVSTEDGGALLGFVVFEINGVTSYLRYWFTHPAHREQGVGSALLRRFFAECRASKRQLFWVLDTNTNAIERYRHYGFRDEAMTDDILVRKIDNSENKIR